MLILGHLQGFFAQNVSLIWSEKPQNKHHFYGIAIDDSARIHFVGTASCGATPKPQSATIFLYKNEVLIDTITQAIVFNGNQANINCTIAIKGEIASYKTVFCIGNTSVIADSIKAGIFILCSGQSNMVASYPQTAVQTHIPFDPYIGSYGNATKNPVSAMQAYSFKFHLADPNSAYVHGSVGILAFYLAKTLKDSLQLPICVLNGAVGGTSIVAHLKNATSYIDSTSIYDRLLLRVIKSKVANDQIRAFFWFQGESDVLNPVSAYLTNFISLTDSLRKDYGANLPIFVAQVHRQCCGASEDSVLDFQELQRNLPNINGIISTNGVALGINDCHFSVNSYMKLGHSMAQLFWAYHQQIDAKKIFPVPIFAQIQNDSMGIKLLMSAPIDTSQLNDCKNLIRISEAGSNNLYPISSISTIEDTLFLHVNTHFSDIHHLFVAYIGSPLLDSMAIWAKTGGALLCFKDLPVALKAPTITFVGDSLQNITICNDSMVSIQTNTPNIAEYFWYKNDTLLPNNANVLNDMVTENPNIYTLKVSYQQGGNLSLASNPLEVNKSIPDTIITANSATTFCENTSFPVLNISNPQLGYTYVWYRNDSIVQMGITASYSPYLEGVYYAMITDINSCSQNTNELTININPLPVANAGLDVSISEGQSVEIGAQPQSNLTYAWFPLTYINNPYLSNPMVSPINTTTYTLVVTDIYTNCSNNDTLNVFVSPINSQVILPNHNTYSDIFLYPNPAHNILGIVILDTNIEKGVINIYNSLGQVHLQQELPYINGKIKEEIDISTWAKGDYLFVFEANGKRIAKVFSKI